MFDNPFILLIAFPLLSYVIGSTPFGVLLARARGVDLRKVGSGNVGATNVARALGRRWGIVCFLLDVAKGLVPTLAAGMILGGWEAVPSPLHQAAWLGAALGCVMGHVLSFWLRFRGGKGVATSLGVVLGIFPYFTWPGLAAFAVWIIVTRASRYVSLGSIAAAAAFLPLFVAFNWPPAKFLKLWPLMIFAAAMVAMLILRHRTNIARLLAGTENKIGGKKLTG